MTTKDHLNPFNMKSFCSEYKRDQREGNDISLKVKKKNNISNLSLILLTFLLAMLSPIIWIIIGTRIIIRFL